MKRKTIVVGLAAIMTVVGISVSASNLIPHRMNGTNMDDMILAALQEKDLLDNFNTPDHAADMQSFSITDDGTNISQSEAQYNVEKAVPCYTVRSLEDYNLTGVDDSKYNIIVPVEKNGQCIGIATLKMGISVNEGEELLAKKDFTETEKQDILNLIQQREGKLYVSSVRKFREGVSTENSLFNQNYVDEKVIATNASITDGKYVYFAQDKMYAYVFNEGTTTYMISYPLTEKTDLARGMLYSMPDALNVINEVK